MNNEDAIQVCVRVRPLLREEALSSNEIHQLAWTWEGKTISQVYGSAQLRKSSNIGTQGRSFDDTHSSPLSYQYDHLFKPEHSNEYVFTSVISAAAEQSMNGFHSSVFAYGQSGSGKTFTVRS